MGNSSFLYAKPFEIQMQSMEKRQNVESAVGNNFSDPTVSLKRKNPNTYFLPRKRPGLRLPAQRVGDLQALF